LEGWLVMVVAICGNEAAGQGAQQGGQPMHHLSCLLAWVAFLRLNECTTGRAAAAAAAAALCWRQLLRASCLPTSKPTTSLTNQATCCAAECSCAGAQGLVGQRPGAAQEACGSGMRAPLPPMATPTQHTSSMVANGAAGNMEQTEAAAAQRSTLPSKVLLFIPVITRPSADAQCGGTDASIKQCARASGHGTLTEGTQ
jgi:hypothetical protein